MTSSACVKVSLYKSVLVKGKRMEVTFIYLYGGIIVGHLENSVFGLLAYYYLLVRRL